MIDERRLRVLLAVARGGSLSAAADLLGYTQPAISHHVGRLEDEVGTKVLERAPGGMRLTAAGELLARRAEAIEGHVQQAQAELDDLLGLRSGTVGLGACPTAFVDLVPGAIAELRREHPGLVVELRQVDRATGLEGLRAGALDVAVVFRDPDETDPWPPDLQVHPLLEDPMRVVLPRGHRLGGRPVVPLRELADDPWILGTDPDGFTVRAARAAGFEPRRAHTTDDLLAAQGFVAAGLGVALGPGLALPSTRDDVLVREVAVGGRTLRREILALVRAAPSAAAERMLQSLQSVAAATTPA
jgi:molybdate transport repressor ModE-like protein